MWSVHNTQQLTTILTVPMQALNIELKAQIPSLWLDGLSTNQICQTLSISKSLVYKVLAQWRTTGSIQAPMTTVGRPRILPGDAIMFIESLLDKDTTLLIDEMKARVSAEFGLDVSTTTLRRTLNSMRCSRKRVTKIAIERNELLRAAFKCRFAELVDNLDMLLCIDESSKDDRTVSRRWVSYTEFGP